MTRFLLFALVLASSQAWAQRLGLDDGRWVDEGGEIHESNFENEHISAPWNDPLKQDDPFAPWNDPIQESDPLAPWNNPISGERETNRYLRENEETESDYYWDK